MLEMNKVYVLNFYYYLRYDIYRVVLFFSMGIDIDCFWNWYIFIYLL